MIIVRIWEGLGNQMFQYAFALSLAQKRKDVFLDLNKAYDSFYHKQITDQQRETTIDRFNISLAGVDVEKMGCYAYLRRRNGIEYLVTELARKMMWPFGYIEEREPNAAPRICKWIRNCYIKGWFQNVNAFRNIRQELLREFTPKKKIKIPKSLKMEMLQMNSVAVHVRRGDYVTGNIALSIKYYYLAKEAIEKRVEKPVYIVFSDDSEWVKKHIDLGENTIFVDDVTDWKDYEQLYAMSRCGHQIIANSTFSWWAAWLNQNRNKVIIMPKKYVAAAPDLKIEGAVTV